MADKFETCASRRCRLVVRTTLEKMGLVDRQVWYSTRKMRSHFGPFCFDTERQLLFKGKTPIELANLPYNLLSYLLSKRGDLVSWEDLAKEVWKMEHVERNAIQVAVNRVRDV